MGIKEKAKLHGKLVLHPTIESCMILNAQTMLWTSTIWWKVMNDFTRTLDYQLQVQIWMSAYFIHACYTQVNTMLCCHLREILMRNMFFDAKLEVIQYGNWWCSINTVLDFWLMQLPQDVRGVETVRIEFYV